MDWWSGHHSLHIWVSWFLQRNYILTAIIAKRNKLSKRERASKRKLDLFPLQRITSSDVILGRTSHDAACSPACQTVKILFAPREIGQWFGNGMEEENTPTKTFIQVAVPENICLQCGKLVDNPALRRKVFSGKQKTKTCQSLEVLLGDVFPRDNSGSSNQCQSKKKISSVKLLFENLSKQLWENLEITILNDCNSGFWENRDLLQHLRPYKAG